MKRTEAVAVVALVLGLTAHGTAMDNAPAAPNAERNGWDREAAARYLDDRMDVWFARTKKLQTGQGTTACISCHTAVPYALARPALRRAMHVPAPTPQEGRLLEEVTRRVATYDTHQVFYDSNDAKTTQSRGTEAVLNALILASADAEPQRRDPGESTQRAFRQLWKTQRPDGAWDWIDFGLEPFESLDATYHGATLAALAIGAVPAVGTSPAPEARAGIEKLRRYLKERYAAQSVFNRVSLLLASTRFTDVLSAAQREGLVAEIQRAQRADGGWSLHTLGTWRWSKPSGLFRPPGKPAPSLLARSDGYATGLIVYALRQAGVPAHHPTVRQGRQWLVAHQQRVDDEQRTYRAWRSLSLNFDREPGGEKDEPWRRMFMSDAATAFAVLALLAPE